jgi:DnaJ-class molecular chaperone
MTSLDKNYYEILGVTRNSSQNEIKKSYFQLALKYHPDRNRHLEHDEYQYNEEKFKEITFAFKTLYDPIERDKYNQILDSKTTRKGYIYYSFYSDKNKKLHFTISSILVNVLNKLFTEEQIQTGKDFFTILKNFIHFSQNEKYHQNVSEIAKNFKFFYQEKNNKRETRKSSDIEKKPTKTIHCLNHNKPEEGMSLEKYVSQNNIPPSKSPLIYNVSVSLDDIYNKVAKELNVARLRKCQLCLGNGYLGYGVHMSLCHVCKGLMKLVDHKVFPININQKNIIFKDEGSEDENGNLNDLIINIHPKANTQFTVVNDYDLVLHKKINLLDFYTEININFRHLDSKEYFITYSDNDIAINKMEIKIPNLGLPKSLSEDSNTNFTDRGDLIIKLDVILPDLSKDEINKIIGLNIFPRTNHNLEHDNLIKLKIINTN